MKFEYYGRDWKIIPQNLSKSQLGMGMEVDDGCGGSTRNGYGGR